MAVPDNPKRWNMLRTQASARFPSKKLTGLSFPAAKWLKDEYVRQGGGFVDSKSQVDPKFIDKKQDELDKVKRKKTEDKRRDRQRGFKT